MDSIVTAINELIPLSKYFIELGLSEEASASLSTAIIFALLSRGLWLFKKINIRQRDAKIAKNLYPQFDLKSIKEATSNYIPTHSQNASPTLEEEPGFSSRHVFRKKLIPFLLKDGFDEMKGANKFHIVLADSGMGKTTFMVNLYMKYVSFWNFGKKNRIRLFRLGSPDSLDLVKKIDPEESKNTILLLDALDEDPFIITQDTQTSKEDAFIERVDKIIDTVKNFKEVVFTCRTQYFPNQEDNPYELKVKRPDEKGYYILKKLYLSPFNRKEIKKYLNKQYPRYKVWSNSEKRRAMSIIENTPKLVVRPMILRYIKDLAEQGKTYNTTFEIYETLIQKWYEREAYKRKYQKDRREFIKNLNNLSIEFATLIIDRYCNNKGLSISADDAILIAAKNNIKLTPNEITGQSLLTCDGYNNWKFAHKSILECYIAKIIFKDRALLMELVNRKFSGLDMTKLFYDEIIYRHPMYMRAVKKGFKLIKPENMHIRVKDNMGGLNELIDYLSEDKPRWPIIEKVIDEVLNRNRNDIEKHLNTKIVNQSSIITLSTQSEIRTIFKDDKHTKSKTLSMMKNSYRPRSKGEEIKINEALFYEVDLSTES